MDPIQQFAHDMEEAAKASEAKRDAELAIRALKGDPIARHLLEQRRTKG